MKRIVEDYEAKLTPSSGRRDGRGKVEWERYGDGNEEFYARFRKLDLPDGAGVEIRVEGAVLGHATLSKGAGRLKFESAKGDQVPGASAGQRVEVVHDGIVVLKGVFRPD